MKKNIQSILEDLYSLDPSLKKDEKELKQIIKKLLEAKPEFKIDENFIQELRDKLNLEEENLNSPVSNLTPNDSMPMLRRIFLPLTGILALGLVVGIVINNEYSQDKNINSDEPSMFAMENQIMPMEPGAFGPLSDLSSNSNPKGERDNLTGTLPSTTATGAPEVNIGPLSSPSSASFVAPSPPINLSNTSESDVAVESTEDKVSLTDSTSGGGIATNNVEEAKMAPNMIIAPPDYTPTVYKYVYKGEPINLNEAKINVFKRLSQRANSESLGATLKNFGFGLMNLGGFENIKVDNINLTQDQKFGYAISLNFLDSSLSLYQNALGWDYPGSKCADDQKCYEDSRIKKDDIPDDKSLISMSDSFLKEHQINRSNYGEPVIQKYWERDTIMYKEQGLPESQIYYPDTVNLVYPLLLEGKTVFDQWGNPMGLNVGVNIYNKKVGSLYGLRSEQFQSSAYQAITDWKVIADYLASGASPYPTYYDENQKVNIKEIEVGMPEKVLVDLWQYKDNQSNEFLAPALKFPILHPEGETIYQENVIVPLAKELLEQETTGGPILYMKDMAPNTYLSPMTMPSAPAAKPIPQS